jgi:hypothetical protein
MMLLDIGVLPCLTALMVQGENVKNSVSMLKSERIYIMLLVTHLQMKFLCFIFSIVSHPYNLFVLWFHTHIICLF